MISLDPSKDKILEMDQVMVDDTDGDTKSLTFTAEKNYQNQSMSKNVIICQVNEEKYEINNIDKSEDVFDQYKLKRKNVHRLSVIRFADANINFKTYLVKCDSDKRFESETHVKQNSMKSDCNTDTLELKDKADGSEHYSAVVRGDLNMEEYSENEQNVLDCETQYEYMNETHQEKIIIQQKEIYLKRRNIL